MDLSIHKVKKIRLGKIERNIGETKVRDIIVEAEGETLTLALFGKRENLQVEIQKTVKA